MDYETKADIRKLSDFNRPKAALKGKERILCLDAARLRTLQLFDGERAGAAISGLPLLAMSAEKVCAILSAVFSHMREDAVLYQFTYGLGCPVQRSIRDRLGLQFERMGSAYANLPPATVYRIWRPSLLGRVGATEPQLRRKHPTPFSPPRRPRRLNLHGSLHTRRVMTKAAPLPLFWPAGDLDHPIMLPRSDKNASAARPLCISPVLPPKRPVIHIIP